MTRPGEVAATSPRPPHAALVRALRAPISARVEMQGPGNDAYRSFFSVNISSGGLFVAMAEPEPPGTFFKLRLYVSDEELVRAYAEVVWALEVSAGPERPAGVGLRFRYLESAGQLIVAGYVAHYHRTLQALGSRPRPVCPAA